MSPTFRRLGAFFGTLLALGLTAHAAGILKLAHRTLSAQEAQQLTQASPPIELPALTGPAAGATPLATARQINPVASVHQPDVWLLARAPDGTQLWLRHIAGQGWSRETPPPLPLRDSLNPVGEANLLAVAAAHDDATLYSYNVITGQWADVGRAPFTGTVTGVKPAKDGFIVLSQDALGVEHYTLTTVTATRHLLSWIDWTVIVVYLVFTAGIGWFFYKKQTKQDNEDFFLAGRKIPWWAAGISLYATGTSAISYLAVPAKSYATNWLYLCANAVGIIGTIIVAVWIVPLLRRLNLMSVYHYLEMRFHPHIRLLASGLNILLQLGGRMSVVLFLPALAMAAVTGLNIYVSIIAMGVVTILYTVLGGMRAVIWTDFIQVIVMLGGAFVAIGYVIAHLNHGAADFFKIAWADDKFKTFDWSFNLTQPTVWGFLFLSIIGVMTIPQDQVMMQRVLSTKSDKEAGWSMWTLAAIVVPGNLVFYGIGTALYVFYKQHPGELNPMLGTDSVFPQFIAGQLPVGIVGLIIAGIFAASMSTLSSCMNSVATMISVDFYERFSKNVTQEKSVRLAEIFTVICGLIGTGTALLLATVHIQSALDTWLSLGGLLGGGFAGCYVLGLFTRRTTWQGAYIGVAFSLVFTFLAWLVHLVHPYFYAPLAVLACVVIGYLTSYFFPRPAQSLQGLTVYTLHQTPVSATLAASGPTGK